MCLSGLLVALLGLGCAHPSSSSQAAPHARHLLNLERDFAVFTGERLDVDDDGRPLDSAGALSKADRALASLEQLRVRYLDLLRDDVEPKTRVTALVRLGELHLDLGARVRRLPYPTEASRDEKLRFDARLSRLALPLEATGLGVLDQALHMAAQTRVEGRMVDRARIYIALHRDRTPLDDTLVRALGEELHGAHTFPAPRRLLEGGRIGQRAARASR